MRRLPFYFGYALRNLWRSRRWSAFAVFSVAAGVATMVALRSLGLSIGDALTGDLRATNKGDITITTSERFFTALSDPDDRSVNLNGDIVRRLENWSAERGARMVGYRYNSGLQLTKIGAVTAGRPQFINGFFINPAQYPLTRDVIADEPAGVPLGDLFTGEGNEVVISRNLADLENIRVGDRVRVSGSEQEFIVRGVVPAAAQAGLFQLMTGEVLSVIFGFAYFDHAAVEGVIETNLGVNRVNILFPDGTSLEQIDEYAQDVWSVVSSHRGGLSIYSTQDLLRMFSFISDVLGRFIVILGLGAMLLGGVGIINTMLVLVRRRTEEIAALKTFGLKGRQVAALFLAEAFWLGLFGSLVGGVVGIGLAALANRFGADLIQQPLTFRIYPEAVLFGGALGVLVSGVFGILPVLSAARVRPAVILRPNEVVSINAGCLPSLLVIAFIVLALGLIAGQILGYPIVGVIGVAATLLLLAILALVLWAVVWLIGKIPPFGSVDLQLALRNLTTRRMRTAITLLALSSGMFALSSISFVGESVREIMQITFSDLLGGNVLIFPVLPQEVARPLIDARLNTLDGVESRTRLMTSRARITQVNGQRPQSSGFDALPNIVVRDTDDPNWQVDGVVQGRTITQADRGRAVAVYQAAQLNFGADEAVAPAPIQVGDTLTLNSFSRSMTITVEIVGIAEGGGMFSIDTAGGGAAVWLPPGVLPTTSTDFTLTLVRAAPDKLNDVLLGLSSLPLVLTFDISFFDSILTRLITQFSALPVLVGVLSLGAAAVITANTVALATLERRRQMGVLRAIGLKSGRVLRVLLLENIVVSLLGALLGIGLSALFVLIMTEFTLGSEFLIPRNSTPIAVVLVLIAVGIGTFATLASGMVAIRERVMNTLRYE